MGRCKRVALLLGWIASCAAGAAQPPTPDPTFGTMGVATATFGSHVDPVTGEELDSYATQVIALPDGRLLALGLQQVAVTPPTTFDDGLGYARVLMRFTGDGTLDTSFGQGGVVSAANGRSVPGKALARQVDGKIIVADNVTVDFQQYIAVSRYDADGTLDHSFGTGGVAIANAFPLASYAANSVMVTRSGAIVVVGRDVRKVIVRALVVRFDASGRLDSAFGAGGVVVVALPTQAIMHDEFFRALEQPDGKIVAVGMHLDRDDNGSQRVEAIALRFARDGALDTSFGNQGRALAPPAPGEASSASSVLLRPDGSLVVGGMLRREQATLPLMMAVTPSGAPDASFGTNGAVLGVSGGFFRAGITDLVLQGDGRIVAGNDGSTLDERPAGGYLSRVSAAGAPDETFGPEGVAPVPGFARVESLAQRHDAKWVAAGGLAPVSSVTTHHVQPLALMRLVGGTVPVVEFRRAAADHYFITSNPLEIHDLDAGIHAGWARTGGGFLAFGTRDATSLSASDVCRYYIPPAAGDSHFLSGSHVECAAVAARVATDTNYADYVLESGAAFVVQMPDFATGSCPARTSAVYRLWNQRADSNHRYTTSRMIRDAMVATGWTSEGYGSEGVAMCGAAP